MSVQHVREVPAVFLDEQVRDRVQQAVDEMDTTEATRYAIIAGLKPPTAEPDWRLCRRFDANGEPGPLIWVHVTETDQ